ncbi:acyl-CoA dehydrogenase family protein [Spongisporangium articulatum]|uniref:Acyl-CoA dehydrogenase family protein n=1 Tax=Spongisporangium articulatum TaxID=3362603 RepID=A0ABW8ATP8_9ACTN
MGIAVTAEQAALQRSVHEWASRTAPGTRPAPEEFGAVGGSLVDAAVALEACGRELVPALSTVLTANLLSGYATTGSLATGLSDGSVAGAVALHGEVTATATATATGAGAGAGAWRLDGSVPHLFGVANGTAAVVLLPARFDGTEAWFALDSTTDGLTVEDLEPFDLSQRVAALRLDDVAGAHPLPGLTRAAVRDLAATLAAAEAAGLAAAALTTAVEYAKVRVQFGRPVGGFQAVKHLCATMLCRAEEAAAVAWDAARAHDEDDRDGSTTAPLASAVAAAVALEAAVDNTRDAIQVLGGIGFTWEHDAHRLFRRALALRQWLGGTAGWRVRAAELVRHGARRPLTLPPAQPAPGLEELRGAVRALIERLPGDPAGRRAALADSGYLVPHWPAPYGVAATAREQLVVEEEFDRAGVERPDLGIAAWAVPTIVRHGTDAQRERFVRPSLRGEITWCQLFSEPEAGSDLASLRTRATRVDGGWSLTGQKVWTSLAHTADWAICLARSDSQAAKHRGITYFLVDMHSPGIETRPLREITGEALFNEVFLTDVFVPDDCVVGEVHGGWRLARTTLAQERVSMGGASALGSHLEALLALKDGEALGDERLGELVARGSAVSLLGLLATARRVEAEDGGQVAPPGPESSVVKLLGVRHRQDVAQAAFDALGEAALAVGPDSGPVLHELLLTRCLSIAGGTTQVLLTVAGERLLGLPREPAVAS